MDPARQKEVTSLAFVQELVKNKWKEILAKAGEVFPNITPETHTLVVGGYLPHPEVYEIGIIPKKGAIYIGEFGEISTDSLHLIRIMGPDSWCVRESDRHCTWNSDRKRWEPPAD